MPGLRPGLQGMGAVSQLLSKALELEILSGVWSLQQLRCWLFTALAFPQPQLSEASAPGCNLGFFCCWAHLGLRTPGGYCFCGFFFFFSDSSAHDKDLECSKNAAHPNLTNFMSVLAIMGGGGAPTQPD